MIRENVGTVFAIGAPGIPNATLRPLTKRVLTGITMHYYEKLFNAYCSEQESRRFFDTKVGDDGMETVERACRAGRGVLLVTGHYGGVEFVPGYLGARGLPVSIVVRFASDRLRRLSRHKAMRFGIEIIDADASPNLFFTICRHLKRNRVVITQCDEIDTWRLNGTGPLSFLGRRLWPDRALNLLARRSRCPVVFCVMHRRPDMAYRFIARSSETVGQGRAGIAEAGLKFIESFVRSHPHQWYQWVKLSTAENDRRARRPSLFSPRRPLRTSSAQGMP